MAAGAAASQQSEALSWEQQSAVLEPLALHMEHSSFLLLAQDASNKEAEARTTERRRIIASCRGWKRFTMKPILLPVSLLRVLHRCWCWRRWWRWLGSAGDEAASDDRGREGEEGVFHSVVRDVCCPSLSTVAEMRFSEANDKSHDCKWPNGQCQGNPRC